MQEMLASVGIHVNLVCPSGIKRNMKLSVVAEDARRKCQDAEAAVNLGSLCLGCPIGVARCAVLVSDLDDYVRGSITTR